MIGFKIYPSFRNLHEKGSKEIKNFFFFEIILKTNLNVINGVFFAPKSKIMLAVLQNITFLKFRVNVIIF